MAYRAGAVFVDVVPSLKGFGQKTLQGVTGPMRQAGQKAGQTFAQATQTGAKGAGAKVGDDFAAAVGKSIPTLKVEAENAGRALEAASDVAGKANDELAQKRRALDEASNEVLATELKLGEARRNNDLPAEAALERQLKTAREAQAQATRDFDQATVAAAHAQFE